MHRQDALLGQADVHDREDGLLDLAGVAGAADQDLAGGEVDGHEAADAGAVDLGVGLELGRVEDDHLGIVGRDLVGVRRDQHRLREHQVPRRLRHDADRDAVVGVGARPGVEDVDVAVVEERDEVLADLRVVLRGDRAVDRTPPDAVLRAGLLDDELVLGGAARVGGGVDDQRAPVGQLRGPGLQRALAELRGREVPVRLAGGREAVGVEVDCAALGGGCGCHRQSCSWVVSLAPDARDRGRRET